MKNKTTKPTRTLIIKKSSWLRQNPNTLINSVLRKRSSGKKCCLGFECLALGIKGITGMATPSDLVWRSSGLKRTDLAKKLSFLISIDKAGYYKNSSACEKLMAINDDRKLSDEQKIEQITKIFGENGIRVKFVE